jgi:thiamine biosynthesis protein ThiS
MIKIRLNGKEKSVKNNITVMDLLNDLDINPQRIAIEINGEILSKSKYSEEIIKEGDIMEIVQFVGGGI